MDAEDWVASWQAAIDESNVYAYLYQQADSVTAVDDMTVAITVGAPDALFLRGLSEWAILPASQYEADGLAGIEANPIGTGPFAFVSWSRGDRIILEARRVLGRGKPLVDRVVFRPIPDSSTRLAAVQTGEVHIAQRFNSEEAATLENAPNVEVVTYPVDRVYYIAFNNLTTGVGTPLENQDVRIAMNHAVDREAIVDSLFDGQAALATGLVSTSSLGHDTSIQPYAYDPELARQMLADAGYPDGFEIGFACPRGRTPTSRKCARRWPATSRRWGSPWTAERSSSWSRASTGTWKPRSSCRPCSVTRGRARSPSRSSVCRAPSAVKERTTRRGRTT
jgi:peptide/nickel transport system substrate-binding protein